VRLQVETCFGRCWVMPRPTAVRLCLPSVQTGYIDRLGTTSRLTRVRLWVDLSLSLSPTLPACHYTVVTWVGQDGRWQRQLSRVATCSGSVSPLTIIGICDTGLHGCFGDVSCWSILIQLALERPESRYRRAFSLSGPPLMTFMASLSFSLMLTPLG
jgi:hypothetical protein